MLIDTAPAPDTAKSADQPVACDADDERVETVQLRVDSDGGFYAVPNDNASMPIKKRKATDFVDAIAKAAELPTTPVKKPRAKSTKPPPAPVKPAPVSRVVPREPSPVVTQILAGIEQWNGDATFEELRDLLVDLRGPYANYSLQRLIATYVGLISSGKGNSDKSLRQLLLICFGYASGSQESRVILRDIIRLPNFIKKDSTVVLKHCKTLLGTNFPHEEQSTVIGVMRGLWHLFERVEILPTVLLITDRLKWVYENVDDCVKKAVGL